MTPSQSAIRIQHKSQVLFYCSEECYESARNAQKEREEKETQYHRIYELVVEICGGKQFTPSVVRKETDDWLTLADFETLNDYLTSNSQYLFDQISRKEFQSTYGMLRYLSAIIKNRVVSHKLPPKKIIHNDDIFAYKIRIVAQNKRIGFKELEDAV